MNRYTSLLNLSTFSMDKLKLLQSKRVLIIGVGGVGQHVSTYLITNGIMHLSIVDFDKVELSNLNRQILLTESDVGKYKVEVVKEALQNKNKEAEISAINLKINKDNIKDIVSNYDVIIDSVDNWETKLIIAEEIRDKNILHLHIGVDGDRGQYCLFKNKSLLDLFDSSIEKSPHDGVMGPMVGILSSLASLHLLKYLCGEDVETDTLFYYEGDINNIGKMHI